MSEKIERRFVARELRAEGEGETAKIVGYGAVFNVLSDDLGGFKEMIMPGTFERAIAEDDVRGLFNHNPNMVLGRNGAGTLTLVEDEIGLRYEILLPETHYARDLLAVVLRGDVNQSSFAFRALEESWRSPTDEHPYPIRILHAVELFDVSPVTFPAYPVTTVQARDRAKQLALGSQETNGASVESNAQGAVGQLALRQRRLDLLNKL